MHKVEAGPFRVSGMFGLPAGPVVQFGNPASIAATMGGHEIRIEIFIAVGHGLLPVSAGELAGNPMVKEMRGAVHHR